MILDPIDSPEARYERERVDRGELPPRYAEPWAELFLHAIADILLPGIRILDVGSGRRPALTPNQRPDRCVYVGLDVSAAELSAAPPGSYDGVVVSDLATWVPSLEESFDAVISWQVLEHVAPLQRALANSYRYLVSGGTFVAMLSGRYSAFALLSRLLPYRLRITLMARLLGVPAAEKFPTSYDKCSYSNLLKLFGSWQAVEIYPRYKGGVYFRFARPLERVYLRYEDFTFNHDLRNLATHYVVIAHK